MIVKKYKIKAKPSDRENDVSTKLLYKTNNISKNISINISGRLSYDVSLFKRQGYLQIIMPYNGWLHVISDSQKGSYQCGNQDNQYSVRIVSGLARTSYIIVYCKYNTSVSHVNIAGTRYNYCTAISHYLAKNDRVNIEPTHGINAYDASGINAVQHITISKNYPNTPYPIRDSRTFNGNDNGGIILELPCTDYGSEYRRYYYTSFPKCPLSGASEEGMNFYKSRIYSHSGYDMVKYLA